MRPSRYLFTLAALFIVLFGVVLGFGSGSFSERLKPKLGLDLVGGTTMTLIARTPDCQAPGADQLEQARRIMENRVNGAGVAEPEVITEGDSHIVINVAAANEEVVEQVGTPAQLRFRTVLATASDLPAAAPTPTVSVTPSPGASGSAQPTPSANAAPTPTASAAPTAGATSPPAASPTTSPSAGPTTSPTSEAACAAVSAEDTPEAEAERVKQEEAVLKTLPASAVSAARGIQDPNQALNDPGLSVALEPFRRLTADQVAVLDPGLQFAVPQITCETLRKRPPGSIEVASRPAVACEAEGNQKYLLAPSTVLGKDVSSAAPVLDTSAGTQWVVSLNFTGKGTEEWSKLTTAAVQQQQQTCPQSIGPGGNCLVAVVLDNEVVSAPEIREVLSSESQISGDFTKESATLLANQLKFGALPLTFERGDLQTVSATLGAEYLRAGLLAAGIGMILVIAYGFFYYRLLGTVIFLSLGLSALLTFGMLVLLGREMGFTLTLAGIAGFIVSLGVAADSFVIYFERLKDEIREGRSPRSAVPRAWVRARRTIITANAVTILAAVLLWLVGVGQVRGFAFALGLATLLDLLIVFLFRHPMMTLLARTPAFLSPRVSGLGRVLQHASKDSPAPGTGRPKEA
jgi:preprotein translocase subunit SecD